MGKPFKISGSTAPRDDRGRFSQMVPPSPPQIVDEARRTGTSVDKVVAEQRVPDHLVEKTEKQPDGGYQEERPWPVAAGPAHKPMRVS